VLIDLPEFLTDPAAAVLHYVAMRHSRTALLRSFGLGPKGLEQHDAVRSRWHRLYRRTLREAGCQRAWRSSRRFESIQEKRITAFALQCLHPPHGALFIVHFLAGKRLNAAARFRPILLKSVCHQPIGDRADRLFPGVVSRPDYEFRALAPPAMILEGPQRVMELLSGEWGLGPDTQAQFLSTSLRKFPQGFVVVTAM
jgi:hypothetical protein